MSAQKNFTTYFLSLAISLSSVVVFAQTNKLPLMPFPDDEQVIVVAEYMEFNGVPMSAFKINSDKSPNEFLNFYRERWAEPQAENVPGFTVVDQEEFTVLSRADLASGALFTVQVQKVSLGGTNATLGVSYLPKVTHIPRLGKGFPLMRKSLVINDILNFDDGAKARTLLIEVSSSVSAATSFYERKLEDLGWSLTKASKDSGYPQQPSNRSGYALSFSKGQQEIQMAFARSNGKTYVSALIQGI